jgi:patatin-like phospholipase/acyl hydrolase
VPSAGGHEEPYYRFTLAHQHQSWPKYNDPARKDCNLKMPLWQLIRASTAAPVYFPAETLQWDPDDKSKTFVFADGGVTPHNSPVFLLYRMATEPAYRLNRETGEKNLLIVSVGTGAAASLGATAASPNKTSFPRSRDFPEG